MAYHGSPPLHCFAHQPQQLRVIGKGIVGAHGAAQHAHAAEFGKICRQGKAIKHGKYFKANALVLQPGGKVAWTVVDIVLDDGNWLHACRKRISW